MVVALKKTIHPFPVFIECFYKLSSTWWKWAAFLFSFKNTPTQPCRLLQTPLERQWKNRTLEFMNPSKQRKDINKGVIFVFSCFDSRAFMWDIYSLVFSCKHYIWEGRLGALFEFYIYVPPVVWQVFFASWEAVSQKFVRRRKSKKRLPL